MYLLASVGSTCGRSCMSLDSIVDMWRQQELIFLFLCLTTAEGSFGRKTPRLRKVRCVSLPCSFIFSLLTCGRAAQRRRLLLNIARGAYIVRDILCTCIRHSSGLSLIPDLYFDIFGLLSDFTSLIVQYLCPLTLAAANLNLLSFAGTNRIVVCNLRV